MVKFRYRLNDNLQPLVSGSVQNYYGSYITGYMEEGIVGQLRHTSMYLVCEMNIVNDTMVYTNPLGIVAKNDIDAATIFAEITGKENGSILCEIVNRCDNIKVEPA